VQSVKPAARLVDRLGNEGAGKHLDHSSAFSNGVILSVWIEPDSNQQSKTSVIRLAFLPEVVNISTLSINGLCRSPIMSGLSPFA